MTDLKPCPFCGEVPSCIGWHYVFCANCSAGGPYSPVKQSAVIAWNTRAALEAPPDETAALRAKLAELERERDELQAAIDSIETSHGLTDNGNLWRFWSKLSSDYGHELAAVKADRDEERKLADDLATWIKAEAEDRGYADGEYPPERQCSGVIARHAARRKEQQG